MAGLDDQLAMLGIGFEPRSLLNLGTRKVPTNLDPLLAGCTLQRDVLGV